MEVQIIENWSRITGQLRAWAPESDLAGYGSAEILVERVDPVGSFPNLLEQARGQILVVLVPHEVARTLPLESGGRIACRVRRGGSKRVFVHPDHVSVSPK
jgi:hypothetical protein